MIDPPLCLKRAIEIDWMLSEPCIVSWQDSNFEPRMLGLGSESVTLLFGLKPKARVWIILIQRTLYSKVSDRPMRFDFFVLLDPHSFLIDKDPLTASSPELAGLPEVHAAESEHGWLSATVQQNHTTSGGRVLMERLESTNKPWSGTPLHRLMQLQSLSNASEFKIYLGNKIDVRTFVNRLNNELPRYIAPVHFNLQKAYEGRGGVWDAWAPYSDELVGGQRFDRLQALNVPPHYSETSAQVNRQTGDTSSRSSLKRATDTQESESSLKKIVRMAEDSFPDCTPTEANTSVRGGWSQQSAQKDLSSEQEQSTQSQSPRDNNSVRLTPRRLQTPEHKNPLPPYQDDEIPPYIAHSSSPESLDRHCLKPTVSTRKYPVDASRKSTDLEVIVAATIQAQMSAIVAQVYDQIKLNETVALAQATIDKHVATHMPTMMQSALSAHLSDVNDEFESASGELQEVKDDAITEMRSARDDVLEELEEEIQVVDVEYRERVSELQEEVFVNIADKMTEFEARIDAKTSVAAPPTYASVVPGTINRIKDAVKAFRDTYQVSLTSEQQVRVLLSFAQYSNAEVSMEADSESKRLLVAHWAGSERHVTNGVPVSLAGRG
ncbi:hypothetical protein E4T47_04107 [Aureobasidium subglaciale]|nr:hypothetical protein E4T47_04107 [Aureobasidium subglaciale]